LLSFLTADEKTKGSEPESKMKYEKNIKMQQLELEYTWMEKRSRRERTDATE
jgi:hypothetical protein